MQEVNKKVEEWLLNPPAGSKAAAARDFGIDLTLLVENLRLTPQERIEKLQKEMIKQHQLSLQNKLKNQDAE